jgi:hypothetical protein
MSEINQRDIKLNEWSHGIELLCAQAMRLKEQPAWRPRGHTGELRQS